MPTSIQDRQQVTGQIEISSTLIEQINREIQNIGQLQSKLKEAQEEAITEVLNILLVATLMLDASDIHMEPERQGTKIRLRIDGLLHDVITLLPHAYETLLARIKLVSGVKLNIADRPQDGRFSFAMGGTNSIEARMATLPAEYGESLVIRILNPKNLIELKDLGLRKEVLQTTLQALKKPNGMILATGPTGCGKTTTLYAFLKEIQQPEIKIVTIEDPIEYHLDGVSQTQVHPERGYDFASGLQAIMRQDPDVLLVGEIRDNATAHISLQAALTGHLVFSTLHTNDAPGTVSRLRSLGAEPMNIGSAASLIIGQRLVRKVCGHCSSLTKASSVELTLFKKALEGSQGAIQSNMSPTLKIARAKGCPTCNNTGYRGRLGIFEIMVIEKTMEEFILGQPSTAALRESAIKRGMTTMYQDGLLKVIEGATTIEEVARVTGEYK